MPIEPSCACAPHWAKSRGYLGGRFDNFNFFFSGEGRGSPRRQERRGGGLVLIENPKERGSRRRGKGGEGRPGGCLRGIFLFLGGGLILVFSGPKFPPSYSSKRKGIQEPRKGGFSKRGFLQCPVPRRRREKSTPNILVPAVHLALGEPRPREAYLFAKTPF